MKILVVDDEADVIQVTKMVLEGEGYKVIPAYSGKEALNILKKEKVDLILLDVMMPGMNGYEVVEAIRKNPSLKEMPVIMVTIKSGFRDIEEGYKFGVDN